MFCKGDIGNNFYIILKGEAFVMIPKTETEMQHDVENLDKISAIAKYQSFMSQTCTIENFIDKPIRRKRKQEKLRSMSVIVPKIANKSIILDALMNEDPMIRRILAENSKILPKGTPGDLTF